MSNTDKHNLPPFAVIEAATKGDVTAINALLRHYGAYIAALSKRPLWDEYGRIHMAVDPDIQRRLETKFVTRILTFKVA